MTVKPKGRIGSSFDDFLGEEGIFEEVQAGSLEKVVRIDMAIMLPKLTMVVMAKRLNTNCRQL